MRSNWIQRVTYWNDRTVSQRWDRLYTPPPPTLTRRSEDGWNRKVRFLRAQWDTVLIGIYGKISFKSFDQTTSFREDSEKEKLCEAAAFLHICKPNTCYSLWCILITAILSLFPSHRLKHTYMCTVIKAGHRVSACELLHKHQGGLRVSPHVIRMEVVHGQTTLK